MTSHSFVFAQKATCVEQVIEQLQASMQAKGDCIWAAVMDTAFDHGQASAFAPLYRLAPHACSASAVAAAPPRGALASLGRPGADENLFINCYAFADLQGLAEAAPCLITLPSTGAPELKTRLRSLLHHCSGRPMLSFVALDKNGAAAAAEHWQPLHWIVHDGQKLLLRFADTRTLAALPAILAPAQWAAWTAPVRAWWYIDRSGALASLPLPGPQPAVTLASLPMEMNDAQFCAFTECSLPDSALLFLQQQLPDIIPADMEGQAFYILASQSLTLAQQHSIDHWGDQIALIAAACMSSGMLLQAPELCPLLATHAWGPGELGPYLASQPALQPYTAQSNSEAAL